MPGEAYGLLPGRSKDWGSIMNKTKQPVSHAKRKRVLVENLWGYAFVGGNVLLLLMLVFYPLCYSLNMCFQKWNPIRGGTYNNFKNFPKLLSDNLFHLSLINNAQYALWTIIGGFIISFGAAVLVKSLPSRRVRNGLRFVYFTPSICNTIMLALMWCYLFQGNNGCINAILKLFGASSFPGWLTDPTWAKVSLYWIVIWSNLGYWMVVFLTKLMDIPETYYEAARIDGADFFTCFRHITLPLSTPIIFLYLSMALITCWGQFDIPQTLASSGGGMTAAGYMGPGNALLLPTYSIYTSAFQDMNFGFAAVKGWVLIVIITVLTLINNGLSKLWVHYDE